MSTSFAADIVTQSADFDPAARRAVAHRVKMQARLYARRPLLLDALYPGLSAAPAGTLVAIAEHLVARERVSPRRWFGFGGEISLLNARAALLLGRAGRRFSKAAPSRDGK